MDNQEILQNGSFKYVQKLAWLANVSIAKLCEESGVSESTVYRWKDDETDANMSTIKKLQEASERLQLQNPFLKQQ